MMLRDTSLDSPTATKGYGEFNCDVLSYQQAFESTPLARAKNRYKMTHSL